MITRPTRSLLCTPRFDLFMVTLDHVGGDWSGYTYDVYHMATGSLMASAVQINTGIHECRRNYIYASRQPATHGIAASTFAHGEDRFIILDSNEWYQGRTYSADFLSTLVTPSVGNEAFAIYNYARGIRDVIPFIDLFDHAPAYGTELINSLNIDGVASVIESGVSTETIKQFTPFTINFLCDVAFTGSNHTVEKKFKINSVDHKMFLENYTPENEYVAATVAPHLNAFIPWVGAFQSQDPIYNRGVCFVNENFKIVIYKMLFDSLYFTQMPAPHYNTLQPRP